MRKKWIPLLFLGFLAFVAVGGLVVRELWNWLLPPLLGARTVTFWQALGILALCRILFGGFGVRGGHGGGKRGGRMTHEERERLRHGMPSQGGGTSAPTVI